MTALASPLAIGPRLALELRRDPPRCGQLADERRAALFGRGVAIRVVPERPQPRADIVIERGDAWLELDALPEADAWQVGDRVLVALEPGDEAAGERYVAWLARLAGVPRDCSLAPWSRGPGGTARLWAIAVARLLLPDHVGVEARHDLIGIRLAQIALAFGADTLAGPIAADRKLPVAGVTRPTEATLGGLRNLISQAGLEPLTPP
jgi:hypothetical protein